MKNYVTSGCILLAGMCVTPLLAISFGLLQSNPPIDGKTFTVTPYWNSFAYRVFSTLSGHPRTIDDLKKSACSDYKEPTHCEQTVGEMVQNTTSEGYWLKLKASNGMIYTLNVAVCKLWDDKKRRFGKKCSKVPDTSNSYDALADDQWLYLRFESPLKEGTFEAFYIFDIGAVKEAPIQSERTETDLVLNVSSVPPGADIELDGSFVGSTPSSIYSRSGEHTLKITKKGYVPWERKVNLTGGKVNVAAELEHQAKPPQ